MDARRAVEHRELTATAEGRIDAAIAAAYPDLSRARVQRLVAEGHVTLNGETARKSARTAPGDRVTITIPLTEHAPAAAIPSVTVLYEDNEVVAVDKRPGLVVHGGPGETSPSLVAWFVDRYPESAAQFEADRPGVVHRLDKDTSGVVIMARTPAAQAGLSAAFEAREVTKLYLAITDGIPERREAVIEAPVGRHPGDRTKMAIVRRGREARTGYEVLADDGRRALLLVRLYTGRTHQVRVHLAAIGAPVAMDSVYGAGGEGRQLLHAWRLTVPHPAGGDLEVTAPAPPDIVAAIRGMRPEGLAFEYSQPVAPVRRNTTPGAETP